MTDRTSACGTGAVKGNSGQAAAAGGTTDACRQLGHFATPGELVPDEVADMISAMDASYELFDHTADMGVRVRADTLAGLIRPAAQGLYATIGELVGSVARGPLHFDESGEDRAILLRDFLSHLLLLFERDQRLLTGIEQVDFSDCRLLVEGEVAAVDQERSAFHREVKAITYHELAIREADGGFEATYIVDI